MKQILQSLKTGAVEVAEVPAPTVGRHELQIETAVTLVSAGTERMLVQFGKSGWLGKARQQPDKVRDVIRKARTDGLKPTFDAVRNKLDQPLPLGYCNAGRVLAAGAGVHGFAVGQRVVSNGKHAGVVAVPANLAAAIPDAVEDDEAALTVVAAIALQGMRLAAPTLGECVVVSGLGLIGLIAVQLLVANGCRVLGFDFSAERLALAKQFGAEVHDLSAGEPLLAAERFSRGRGVDAVLVAASTSSSDPIRQAAEMCRKRGRIVLVGVTGLELSRADFYEKELSFQVSCSYGPGRYDPAYEAGGQDYPAAFVRWTAQRNFEAVLDMMAQRRIDLRPLVTHRFAVAEADDAYALVDGGGPSLGIILDFAGTNNPSAAPAPAAPTPVPATGAGMVGFIGAGGYAGSVLIPAFKDAGAVLGTVVSASGVSALHAQRKFGFARSGTDAAAAIASDPSDTIVIATRHDGHARWVRAALQAGRHVFVEKPLALTLEDVDAIEAEWRAAGNRQLMVGFNRRFSPLTEALVAALARRSAAKAILMTVNAGAIPAGHWTHDPAVGGGRVVGEGVHFIDLARHLSGSAITSFAVAPLATPAGDSAAIQLGFANGDVATINYLANGSKDVAKERVEVFCGGAIYAIDNWRKLSVHGDKATKPVRLWAQDKGQAAMAKRFLAAVHGEAPPAVAPDELFETARAAIRIAAAAAGA